MNGCYDLVHAIFWHSIFKILTNQNIDIEKIGEVSENHSITLNQSRTLICFSHYIDL